MSEVVTPEQPPLLLEDTKPVRQVVSNLYTGPVTVREGRPGYEAYKKRMLIHKRISAIDNNPEYNLERKFDLVAKFASDAYHKDHDPLISAIAIALITHTASLEGIDGIPTNKEREDALPREESMREDVSKRANLPPDFWEANGYYKPVK